MKHILSLCMAALLFGGVAHAQSVEGYAGTKRKGFDLMWFKNFKNSHEERTPFLFFSRNRASIDATNNATAFGSTQAISYNFKNGLGLVAVASFLNAGLTPKAGIQYYQAKGDFMFFGWLVADVKDNGGIDAFGLFRYQPRINKHWKGFGQVELFPVYTPNTEAWNITQRLRIGAKYHAWAVGLMADFNQIRNVSLAKSHNLGAFLRHEF